MRLALASCALPLLVLSACGTDDSSPEGSAVASSVSEADAEAGGVPGSGGPLGAVPVPPENPLTPEKVALGRQLFFEARLSVDGSRSCYSCHQNQNGNGGGMPTAIGAAGRQLTRHSPVIWNVAYMPRFYWDGRSGSLEAQVKGAWGGGNMGVGAENLDAKAHEIGAIPGYAEQFQAVFGERGATAETVAEAIASYERTLVCDGTRYDDYMAGERTALNEEERTGLDLFNGKAACATCHTAPFFTAQVASEEGVYYNVGIGIHGKAEEEVDVGRQAVTELDTDWAAFKVPSLRNVAVSAPYFHDGSVGDLETAVRYMAGPGAANKNLTPLLVDRGLSDEEIQALVAFLGSLTCSGELTKPGLPGG